jgi:hypothetical protein
MSYQITHFGSVALPITNPVQDRGVPEIGSSLARVIGGVVDWYGAGQRLPDVHQIQISGIYYGEPGAIINQAGSFLATSAGDHISAGSAINRLRSQIDDLAAMEGKTDQLWRTLADNGQRQWKMARLLSIVRESKVDERLIRAQLRCRFESGQPGWCVASSTTATGSANAPLLASVGGNMPVCDAVLAITASELITAISITAGSCRLAWSGSLAAGQKLTIDTGLRTVRIGTATNAYSGFSIAAGHAAQRWLELAPGINTIYLRTNGAATVTATYYDQWL